MSPIPPAAPQSTTSPHRKHLGHGRVCTDTVCGPRIETPDIEWTLHHPLSFSAIRRLPSSDLWHLHAQLCELIRNCYGSLFALDDGDGLDDPGLVARHDSWVLVDMLLREREMGLKPEPISHSRIITTDPSPPSEVADSWQDMSIIVRDFAEGVRRVTTAETRLKLSDIYDLADYEDRKLVHLAALSGRPDPKCRWSSGGSSSRSPSPTTVIWTGDLSMQSGTVSPQDEGCQYGCRGDCCKLKHPSPQADNHPIEESDLVMSGALLGSKRASISPLFTDFFIRDKPASRPAWFRRSGSMFGSTPQTPRTPSLDDSCPSTPGAPTRGRQRFDDVTRRLSNVSLACRNLLNPGAKIPVVRVSKEEEKDFGDQLRRRSRS